MHKRSKKKEDRLTAALNEYNTLANESARPDVNGLINKHKLNINSKHFQFIRKQRGIPSARDRHVSIYDEIAPFLDEGCSIADIVNKVKYPRYAIKT